MRIRSNLDELILLAAFIVTMTAVAALSFAVWLHP